MFTTRLRLWMMITLVHVLVSSSVGSHLPPHSDVLAAGTKANNFFQTSPPGTGPLDAGYCQRNHCQNDCQWVVSTYAIGLAEFYETSEALNNDSVGGASCPTVVGSAWPNTSKCFLKFWADQNLNFQICHEPDAVSFAEPPIPPSGTVHHADSQLCGATYAELYRLDGKQNATFIQNTMKIFDEEVANKSSNINWDWVDALHMAMNPYARIGDVTGEVKYFDKMFDNFVQSVFAPPRGLYGFWNSTDSLFYRDYRYLGTQIYWARGNAWAMAALVTALRFVPESRADHRAVYLELFVNQSSRLVTLQGSDGAWRPSLLQAKEYPSAETTGTAYFVYGLAYGVNAGILKGTSYVTAVQRGWKFLSTIALQPNGFLGYCQPIGFSPTKDIFANMTNPFCLGMFLTATSEVAKMSSSAHIENM
eukprot:m.202907 g.202907  ORF g.202907 m.202907 type:complete len:420 (+) comp32839_c1_seq2:150-1409(+)